MAQKKYKKNEKKNVVATNKRNWNCSVDSDKFRRFPLWVALSFALVCWLLFVIFEHDYLFRVQELSLFLSTKLYFQQLMVVPGGFLSYLGSFLNQFFYYPALGAFLLVLLWVGIYFATLKTFRITNKWALLALIPVLALLASDMELGYWIFHIKVKGYFFYNSLGFLFAVLSVWAFRSMPTKFRYLWVAVWCFLGYPLFGYYTVFGALCMALLAFRLPASKNLKSILFGYTFVCLLSAPLLWYHFYFTQTNRAFIYVAGLPNFEWIQRDLFTWVPFIVLTLCLLLFPFIPSRIGESSGTNNFKKYLIGQSLLLILLLFGTQLFWYRDANFRAEVKMGVAMEDLKWQKVLDIAKAETGTPTRLMVMNKNLALIKLGRLGDEMFHYLDGGEKPNCPFEVRLMQVGGKTLYYHYAKFNFCYRWCLEDGVEFGWKVDYLKYLVKCSLMSGEYPLAQKYINTLKKTLFYKGWAEKYEKFINHPELITKDKEFSSILPLYCYDNQLDGDNTLVEIYLLNFFSHNSTENNTLMYDEVAMMAALTLKDIPTFWECFFRYAESHKTQRMPTHFQEAALLYGNLEKKVDISRMPFDKVIVQRFNQFMNFTKQHQGHSEEELKPTFYPIFGDTFYYFYFFIRNVKSY